MKICFCANSCWYLHNFRRNTIKRLLDAGEEVFCIAPVDRYADELVALGCTHLPWAVDPKGTNLFREVAALIKLSDRIKEANADVILTFNPKVNIYAGLICKVWNKKQVANISGLGVMNGKGYLARMFYFSLYRFSLGQAHHVFFQNERDRDLFLDWSVIASSRTSRLMGSGVDLRKFVYASMPIAPPTKFVFIGRLIEEKGIRLFVEAYSRLKEKHGSAVDGSVVGILEERGVRGAIQPSELKEWQDKLGVLYRGASDSVEKLLPLEHFVVLPTFYAEGVPRAALEASAVGRAVVTTRLPGCTDAVVDGVTGYLCKPNDVDSLFTAMDAAASSSSSERTRMGTAARSRMEKYFDEEQNIARYLDVIHSALVRPLRSEGIGK